MYWYWWILIVVVVLAVAGGLAWLYGRKLMIDDDETKGGQAPGPLHAKRGRHCPCGLHPSFRRRCAGRAREAVLVVF